MTQLDILSFKEAAERTLQACRSIEERETLLIDALLHRILAEDIVVRKNLPSFDNSAMDGFAFNYADEERTLTIKATIFAGEKPEALLEKGECYKIMTGAQVPGDADTIVPIEACSSVTEEQVTIPRSIRKGNAFRAKGEEQKRGEVLFRRGEYLSPAHIALLSAQGIMAAEVYRELRIAILSTGNEIREPWEQANEDEIYNANAFAIASLLKRYGFDSTYVGAAPDDLKKTTALITELRSYDVVISTGGISMGDADFLEEAFLRNGLEPLFHGVNVKPGRPTMMGTMGDTFVMAMPGNPLTASLNTMLLSLPILFKMQGSSRCRHDFLYARSAKAFKMRPGRSNIVLGSVLHGAFHVTRENRYGSGMLTPIVESNAVAVFDEKIGEVVEGAWIKVILFDTLPLSEEDDTINGEETAPRRAV